MMFIDKVELTLTSGKGGAGCVAFRREKFVVHGGPDGGDGGRGGNVVFVVDGNSHTLSSFRGLRELKAGNGAQGQGRKKAGKSGEHLYIPVPPGTQVIDVETGAVLADLIEDGKQVMFLEGGKGGLGNWHFRNAINQKPEYAQPGLVGESKLVRLEIKLIADVGLVGFPNVGKSTLISSISNARPEVADYEFTTLTPKLGVVNVDNANSFVMADIPGIIEGASDGKGLGLAFLKHIERTKFLLFMIDLANYRDLQTQFTTLKHELGCFSPELATREYAIALTRCDVLSKEEIDEKCKPFFEFLGVAQGEPKNAVDETLPFYFDTVGAPNPRFVLPISSVTTTNIPSLIYALSEGVLGESRHQSW